MSRYASEVVKSLTHFLSLLLPPPGDCQDSSENPRPQGLSLPAFRLSCACPTGLWGGGGVPRVVTRPNNFPRIGGCDFHRSYTECLSPPVSHLFKANAGKEQLLFSPSLIALTTSESAASIFILFWHPTCCRPLPSAHAQHHPVQLAESARVHAPGGVWEEAALAAALGQSDRGEGGVQRRVHLLVSQ